MIAMVGSRKASPQGLEQARAFASQLCQHGFAISSGMALGIDGASHQAALEVAGTTCAVLGTGVEHIYPKRHLALSHVISERGLLLSEFPIDYPPRRLNFPRRNRIISGISHATLVVEADAKSGSLITARYALEQNREVFALPCSIQNRQAQGCNELIKQGAKLTNCVEDILEELPQWRCAKPVQTFKNLDNPYHKKLEIDHQKLVKCLGYEATNEDTLIKRSGFSASKINTLLLTLELNGLIQAVPGGYVATPNSKAIINE